ncbi:hypothetical protein [Thiobacillus sp.]|uniref:hypothetical protein n=1 Tax=Thiobacillus sp. TaxID=924 RepID=UPI001DDFEFCC|nr:hypothetical protein [Thiobacillus sp.]MBC2738732.1 hypothetical protein [Thiobacillus sp.]MBC2760975.1 hypothetical protein [Thiobacillus sp.]
MRRHSGEMVQALSQPDVSVPALLERLSHLTGALRVTVAPHDPDDWIQADALMTPETGALADFIVRLADAGFGANRRAAAASLLLRHGWAAGPIIAAYLAERRTLRIHDFALRFSASTLVEGVWIRQADLLAGRNPADIGPGVLASLLAFSEPVLESLRRWSGYSRHALWSMLASSWLAQFSTIGELLGDREQAVRAARALLARHPELARALPETYVVASGDRSEVCQILKACCLQHKGFRRRFCPSCPVIQDRERIVRNREWVCRAK